MATIRSVNLTRESPLEESLRLWQEAEQEVAAEPWDLGALLEGTPSPVAAQDLRRLTPLAAEMRQTIRTAKTQFLACERAEPEVHLVKLEEINKSMAGCRNRYSRELLELSAAIIQRQEWDEVLSLYAEMIGIERLAGSVLREGS